MGPNCHIGIHERIGTGDMEPSLNTKQQIYGIPRETPRNLCHAATALTGKMKKSNIWGGRDKQMSWDAMKVRPTRIRQAEDNRWLREINYDCLGKLFIRWSLALSVGGQTKLIWYMLSFGREISHRGSHWRMALSGCESWLLSLFEELRDFLCPHTANHPWEGNIPGRVRWGSSSGRKCLKSAHSLREMQGRWCNTWTGMLLSKVAGVHDIYALNCMILFH